MKRFFKLFSVLIIGLAPTISHANPTIATPQCFIHAANVNHISLSIALALLRTEGGHPGTMKLNKNGSYDLGVMQVNDRTWIPKIANTYFNGDTRKAYTTVRDNGCFNVMMGTQIFATYLKEANGNYLTAIGYYNSHTPKYMERYQRTVMQKYLYVYNVFRNHHLVN